MVQLDPLPGVRPARGHPAPEGGRLLAVASGKGGVGKTWFSITLAHCLAVTGKRTLLFDGDLGLANIDIQLGLMPARDLGEVIAGRSAMQAVVSKPAGANFDVIAGRSGGGNLSALPQARLEALLDELTGVATAYDRVILDLGAGLEKTVRTLAAGADTAIVIATDEPTSLTDAYAFIKLLALRGGDTDIRIVVNMASSPRDGQRTYETLRKACEGFLRISPPLLGVIRRDSTVKAAIRAQVPLLVRSPLCNAASDVGDIAAKLARA